MRMDLPVLVENLQILGDDFGYLMFFPYDINGFTITMTLKKDLASQTDAEADAHVQVTPTGVTADANGNYNVLLSLTAAVTSTLEATTYYFDIVTKDCTCVVQHIISPRSTISFINRVTLNP